MELNNQLLLLSLIAIALMGLINSEEDRTFKCPPNYFKVASECKDCPNGDERNAGGYCDCEGEKEFFNVLSWQCEECPEGSRKDLNSSTCVCQSEVKKALIDDPTLFFNIFTKKCELIETPPCAENQFLDYSDYKCHACTEQAESEGGRATSCECPINSFWNDISKTCQECREGTFTEAKGAKSCICSASKEYWNDYYKNCTDCPDNSTVNGGNSCDCKDNKVLKANENICVECPNDTRKSGNQCLCNDLFQYFDYEKFKCVPCTKNSVRPNENSNICECYPNYIHISGSDLCYRCPNEANGDSCTCEEGSNTYFDKKSFACLTCPKGAKSTDGFCEGCSDSQIIVDGMCVTCPSGSQPNHESNTCECYDDKVYDFANNKCSSCFTCTPCDNDEMSDGTTDYCECKEGYYWDYSKQYCVRRGKNAINYFSSNSVFMETKIFICLILLSLIF